MSVNLENIYRAFYRGFVELDDNKDSIDKYKKGAKLKQYNDLQSLHSYAGVLATDTVFIDVDNLEDSEKIYRIICDNNINCRVTRTTRGRHFTFYNNESLKIKKCNSHIYSALGIEVDVKVGLKNSYEILKYKGELRKVERELDLSRPIARVPAFLYIVDYKPDYPFSKLTDGLGRNQTLFNYILVLQREGLTDDEIKDTIKLINEYVFPEKLSIDELNTIMRDESFKKESFHDGKRFLHEKFGDYIIRMYHVKRINGFLHIYHDGCYRADNRLIENIMLKHIKSLTNNKRQEVYKYMYAQCYESVEDTPANLIAFKNVIYDLNNDETYPLSPEYIITNQVPHDYAPSSYSKVMDDMLTSIANGDENIRALIEEMIGFCFYRRSEHGKCFILKGKASNGKSTLLTVLRALLGEENTSSLDICELADRFSTIMLQGKLANIGDDISDEYIANTAIFKKVVTGNKISAEQKGVEKTQFNPYCKLIFSANNIPRIGKGKDNDAIVRRLKVVPLLAKFTEDDPNFKPYIIDELLGEEAMQYLVLLGIKGLKRWLKTRKFTESKEMDAALAEFEINNNPILGFFKELEDDGLENSLLNHTTNDMHLKYGEYCSRNSHVDLGQTWCTKQLLEHFKDYELRVSSKRKADDKTKTEKISVFVKRGSANDE